MSEQDASNEVILAGMRIPLRGPVPDSNLKVFQGKIVFGDYQQDSDPLLSSFVISDLSGGLGVDDLNESLDINRYRLGTFYTRYPNQITKPFAVTDFATSGAGAVNQRFLGNLIDTATGLWDIVTTGYAGNALKVGSLINGNVGTLTAEPVGNAVVYQGTSGVNRVVIPMGASGVATYSSAAVFGQRAPGGTSSAGTPALQQVVVYDNKLIGIDTSGQLWWTTNPLVSSDAWTSYGPTAKLPAVATIRSMTTYFDRQGLPAVFIVTDTDVWQFDPAGPDIFTVDITFPPHPHHGLAAAKWSGDLYFSVGIGVHRYTGGSLAAMGLDRDHGLPIEYAGYIVGGGLVSGYNSLYAFVTRPDLSGYTFPVSTPDPMSAVYEYTGSGWNMIWESDTDEIVPHSMGISRRDGVGDAFVLFWGTTDTAGGTSAIRQLNLPIGFFNPRQRVRATGGYASSSDIDIWLQTGIFDAGLKGYDKLANALDVTIAEKKVGSVLRVYYQRDAGIEDGPDAVWFELGMVGEVGTTSLPFGELTALDGIYPGEIFQRIRFRFVLTDTSNDGFILESAVFSFIKELPSQWSWTLEVDLTQPYIENAAAINAHLESLLEAGEMVDLILRGETRRVFLSQVSGSMTTGDDPSTYRRVTLLEIPGSLGQAQN